MADNVGYKPGVGATIAADDVSGVLYQRVKVAIGNDGEASDVSSTNPIPTMEKGELVEAIEALRMAVNSLTRTIGLAMPDTTGRLRTAVESSVAITANQGGTWNLQQVGGYATQDVVPAIMNINAASLRANITVT